MSSSTCRTRKIPTPEVYSAWPLARPHLLRAVDSKVSTGEVQIEDVYLSVVSGNADLWLIYKDTVVVAAFVTRVVHYERTPVLLVPYVGGDGVSEWAGLIEDVRAEARARGCKQVELLAREGWTKVYADLGLKRHWTMFRLDAYPYEDAE